MLRTMNATRGSVPGAVYIALVVVVECCCGCLWFRETRVIFLDAAKVDTALADQMEGTGPALKGDGALCSLYAPGGQFHVVVLCGGRVI